MQIFDKKFLFHRFHDGFYTHFISKQPKQQFLQLKTSHIRLKTLYLHCNTSCEDDTNHLNINLSDQS